jgi:hypothetical protein
MRDKLVAGMRLVARYKGEQCMAEVVTGDDGKIRFRLADGREFTSPSAAGSAVMSGVACNGWRWWSVKSTGAAEATSTPREATAALPLYECGRCGKQYVAAAQLAHHEANADRLCTPV